jgi:protein HOOK3
VYQTLLEEHRTLQTNLDDMTSEKADALATVRRLQQESESRRDTGAEPMLKAEIDRLRIDLYVPSFGVKESTQNAHLD